jgi:hypothetical protein
VSTVALSRDQRLMLAMERADRARPPQVVTSGLEFAAPLDPVALQQTVHAVAMRHEALCTSLDADGLYGVVAEHPHREAIVGDFSGTPGPDGVRAAADWLGEQACQPFEHGEPPWRLVVANTATRGVGALIFHHAVTDWISTNQVWNEVLAVQAGKALCPDPAPRYTDWTAAEEAWLSSPAADAAREHWAEQLRGAGVAPARHRVDGGARDWASRRVWFDLPAAAEPLRRAARARRGTPALVALTAFAETLGAHEQAAPLGIGIPSANRGGVSPGLVGMVLKVLPIFTRPDHLDVAASIREQTVHALEHQRLPTSELLGLVPHRRPDAPASTDALFTVRFLFLEAAALPPEFGARPVEIDPERATFEMTVAMWLRGDRLFGRFEHLRAAIGREAAEALVLDFVSRLERTIGLDGRSASRVCPDGVHPLAVGRGDDD